MTHHTLLMAGKDCLLLGSVFGYVGLFTFVLLWVAGKAQ